MNNQPTEPKTKSLSAGTIFVILVCAVILIGFCAAVFYYISPGHMPENYSKQGAGVDSLIWLVHILMAVLFVGWLAYFFFAIFRFRKTVNPKADYVGVKSHASSYLEGVVALIEGILLVCFAIPIWAHAVDQFPKDKDATVIKIIAQQFQWNGWYPGPSGFFAANDKKFVSGDNTFGLDKNDPHYKENFIISKDLVVPIGKPVLLYISSLDVIHCFTIKQMRVTQDAIPGLVIPAWFDPAKEGTYPINCAQLCGDSHYGMKGTMKVVSQDEYAKWVASKSSAGGAGGGLE